MTAPIEAVVFDIGGVLLDWNPRYLYSRLIPDEAACEAFLTGICTDAWNAELDRGLDWDEALQLLCAQYPDHRDLIHAYRDRWIEMIRGANDEVVAIMEALRTRGYPIYSITNFNDVTYRIAAERFDFLNRFDGVIVSGDVRLLKPDPAIYQLLLDRYGLRASALYFTDDRADNVEAARALGFQSDVFTSAAQLRADLERRGIDLGVEGRTACVS